MRRAGRPLRPVLQREAAGQAGDCGAFQRLAHAHGRQQAGEALRQHRFAGPGRAHQQEAVAAGRGDLQGPARTGLALHVSEVGVARCRAWCGRGEARPAVFRLVLTRFRALLPGQELPHHVQQMPRPHHLRLGHQRGLFGAGRRQHQTCRDAGGMQRQAGRQRPAHRPQLA